MRQIKKALEHDLIVLLTHLELVGTFWVVDIENGVGTGLGSLLNLAVTELEIQLEVCLLVLCLGLHELAHARVADRVGLQRHANNRLG